MILHSPEERHHCLFNGSIRLKGKKETLMLVLDFITIKICHLMGFGALMYLFMK